MFKCTPDNFLPRKQTPNPGQGPYFFAIMAAKVHEQMREKRTTVMNGRKTVIVNSIIFAKSVKTHIFNVEIRNKGMIYQNK